MRVRRIIVIVLFFLLGVALFVPLGHLFAQDAVSEALSRLSSENVRGYVQPLVEGFGANLNSGLYHTPGLHRDGLHARLEIVGSGTLVGERERHYDAVPPEPFDRSPVRTATILGGVGTTVTGPGGEEYRFEDGQVRADLFGLGTPQLTLGNLFGTEATVRYAVLPSVRDFPRTSLVGYGLRHSLNRYFPGLPIEATVGLFRQNLDVGDIIAVSSTNVAVMVGKPVSLFTIYGGMQYESTVVDVDYTYTGYGSSNGSRVRLSFESAHVLRFTTGFGINLAGLNLCTDIGIGKVTVVTGSLGVGF